MKDGLPEIASSVRRRIAVGSNTGHGVVRLGDQIDGDSMDPGVPFFSTGLFENTRFRIGQTERELLYPASSLLLPAVRLALSIPALPRRTMFPLPATYFRQPLPPVIGATVSEYCGLI